MATDLTHRISRHRQLAGSSSLTTTGWVGLPIELRLRLVGILERLPDGDQLRVSDSLRRTGSRRRNLRRVDGTSDSPGSSSTARESGAAHAAFASSEHMIRSRLSWNLSSSFLSAGRPKNDVNSLDPPNWVRASLLTPCRICRPGCALIHHLNREAAFDRPCVDSPAMPAPKIVTVGLHFALAAPIVNAQPWLRRLVVARRFEIGLIATLPSAHV